jgi:hypothetical protein
MTGACHARSCSNRQLRFPKGPSYRELASKHIDFLFISLHNGHDYRMPKAAVAGETSAAAVPAGWNETVAGRKQSSAQSTGKQYFNSRGWMFEP